MNRFVTICLFCMFGFAVSCAKPEKSGNSAKGKMTVVATLFPVYDFSRAIAGDKAKVTLLVPPGVEAHDFEPRPSDMVALDQAAVFVYTSGLMEPWAGGLLNGVQNKDLAVVDASKGIPLLDGGEQGADPHYWMDFSNARIMVDNIAGALSRRDAANAAYYQRNAERLKGELAALDEKYSSGLKTCRTRVFAHGGHFAFAYLARKYNLRYVSAFDFSPDAEPSPSLMAELVKLARKEKLKAVFYEELVNPRVAQTIAAETGADLLAINSAHDLQADDLKKGVTFMSMMEDNLEKLERGLECRK